MRGLLETASAAGASCGRGEVRHVDTLQERHCVIHTSTAGADSTWLGDWTRRCGRPSSVLYMSFSWLDLRHLWWSSCTSVSQTCGRTHRCRTYFWTGIAHIGSMLSKPKVLACILLLLISNLRTGNGFALQQRSQNPMGLCNGWSLRCCPMLHVPVDPGPSQTSVSDRSSYSHHVVPVWQSGLAQMHEDDGLWLCSRSILFRRLCSLMGTVFLLRCCTMFVTSLSVPGQHLKCASKVGIEWEWVWMRFALLFFFLPAPQSILDLNFLCNRWETAATIILICTHGFRLISVQTYDDTFAKIQRALAIWSGFGMTLAGVQTCGDYMFSGHTVVITMLNFFVTECKYWHVCLLLITEYSKPPNDRMKLTLCCILPWLNGIYFFHLITDTPRSWNLIHTISWVLNLFGIFFILAAHEHYSIDVFIAFYITTRLFLYYHTLANTRAYQQSRRARIWFPMFSFFECNVNGPVPNQYHWPFERPAFMKTLIG